jgi:aarF domain-containing kinase
LDGRNRRNFLDLFQSVAEFDGYKAGKLMVERCRTPELVIDEETFALKMQHLILSVKSKTFSLAKIKISDILTDVLTAVRRHHVKLEGDFVNTVISILLLEGIGRQLDPNMDLFKSALPILRQLGRQLGTREAIAAVPKGNIWAMAKVSEQAGFLPCIASQSTISDSRSCGSGSRRGKSSARPRRLMSGSR